MVNVYLELYSPKNSDDWIATALSSHREFIQETKNSKAVHIVYGKSRVFYMVFSSKYVTRTEAIELAKQWYFKTRIVNISLKVHDDIPF